MENINISKPNGYLTKKEESRIVSRCRLTWQSK